MLDSEQALELVRSCPLIAYDTETTGLSWRADAPIGYVITKSPEENYYIPIRHGGGGNLIGGVAMSEPDSPFEIHPFEVALAEAFVERNKKGYRTIGHNTKFDAHFSANAGVMLGRNLYDTSITQALINEYTKKWALADLAEAYGVAAKKGDEMYAHLAALFGGEPVKSQMANFWRTAGTDPVAVAYALGDGVSTLELHHAQMKHIEAQDLQLVHTMESDLIWTVFRMERRGIKIDLDYCKDLGEIIDKEIVAAEAALPKDLNVRSAKQIKGYMEEVKRTDWPVTDKGNASFPEKWLKNFPEGQNIVALRKWGHLKNSFLTPLVEEHAHNGRVHPNLNQTKSDDFGTVTGRFSCCLPAHVTVSVEDGEVQLGDIRPGDKVYTHTGALHRVRHRIYSGKQEIFKIVLTNGRSVECTSNHRLGTNKGWKSLEDIYEHIQGSSIQSTHLAACCAKVPWAQEAYHQGGSAGVGGRAALCTSYIEPRFNAGGILQGEEATVFERENRGFEPDGWALRGLTPKLQGRLFRPQRVLDRNPSEGNGGRRASDVTTSRGIVEGVRGKQIAGRVSRTPHKRRQDRQPTKEFSVSVACRARRDTPVYAHIRSVEFVGIAPVYDLEVEHDHSFVANGIIVHNSSPNLQQLPKHNKDIAKPFRRAFVADEGKILYERDWSQCEPRLFAHYSGDEVLLEGYRCDPPVDMHDNTARMLGVERDPTAKRMNLGILMGMYPKTFAAHMDWPADKAINVWEAWYHKYPKIAEFQDLAKSVWKSRGYVKTLLGRRCRLDNPRFCYAAANRISQGGNADIVKWKLLEIDRWLEGNGDPVELLMTVHDSIVYQGPETAEGLAAHKKIGEIMEDVQSEPFNLKVPFTTDTGSGKNWAIATFGEDT